jgi:predicted amidophosphoribosyltransferase
MDTLDPSSEACANCSAAIMRGQNYCPICGRKAPTPRLTLHAICAEFVHALAHVDRSALSLIW